METITQKRAEKIARNINAMDTAYQYSGNIRDVRFWDGLNKKIHKILSSLTHNDIVMIASICEKDKAEFFGIVEK